MLFAVNAMAQLITLEKKKLKLMALEVVLKYESAASVSNDDLKDDFIKLFDDIDVEVLNDVLPDNGLDTKVAVKNYIDIIPAYFAYSLKISVVPYEVELIDENSREVFINVSAKKTISGTESKTQLLYYDTLDIDFSLKYNKATNSMKITGITLLQDPTKFVVIKATKSVLFKAKPIINDSIVINNKGYQTNEYGLVLVRKLKKNQSLVILPGSDRLRGITNISSDKIQNTGTSRSVITAPFRLSFIDIAPTFGLIPSDKSPISFPNAMNKNAGSYETGINLGIRVVDKQKGYWKLITGLTYFSYNGEHTLREYKQNYQTVDPDGANYIRTNEIQNYKQASTISGISIPIAVEKGFNLGKKTGFMINSGIAYAKILESTAKLNASAQYSGLYPDFFNVTIKENGVSDYGNYELADRKVLAPTNHFWTAQVTGGFYYKLSPTLNLTTTLTYKQNITDMFNLEQKSISSNRNEINTLNVAGMNANLKLFIFNIGILYKL